MGTLIIQNLSKKTSINLKAERCDTFISRLIGLMFKKKPTNLFFKFDELDFHPIHSFFVFFPFDAIYLIKKGKYFIVVDFFENVQINQFIFPNHKNFFLLELQNKKKKKLKINVGDKLACWWKNEK